MIGLASSIDLQSPRGRSMGQWFIGLLLATAALMATTRVSARENIPESGPPLQTVVEVETTARLLAILFDSGRAVINENQERFDLPKKVGKADFTPALFE